MGTCFLRPLFCLAYPFLRSRTYTTQTPRLFRFRAVVFRSRGRSFATMSGVKRKANTAATPANDTKKPKANGSIMSFFGAPKTGAGAASASGGSASATSSAPAVKFDKEKWVSSLTDEQKSLLQLEIDTLHESWLVHLKDELVTREFLELKRFLKKETDAGRKWFPPPQEVYTW